MSVWLIQLEGEPAGTPSTAALSTVTLSPLAEHGCVLQRDRFTESSEQRTLQRREQSPECEAASPVIPDTFQSDWVSFEFALSSGLLSVFCGN